MNPELNRLSNIIDDLGNVLMRMGHKLPPVTDDITSYNLTILATAMAALKKLAGEIGGRAGDASEPAKQNPLVPGGGEIESTYFSLSGATMTEEQSDRIADMLVKPSKGR
jgi:hypothetical protein